MYKLAVLAVVAVAVTAVPVEYGHGHEGHHHHVDYYVEPHYSFHYEVKDPHTKDIKSHKEERKGDHTSGVYSLVEPDGSMRVVEYVVEGKKGGFLSKVHREHNKHPAGHHDKHGHHSGHGEAISHANVNIHGGHVHEVSYHAEPSHHGSQSAVQSGHHASQSTEQSGHHASHGGAEQQSHSAYHVQPVHHAESSYSHGGHGEATSSIHISTHGAKLYTSTKHVVPQKHHY